MVAIECMKASKKIYLVIINILEEKCNKFLWGHFLQNPDKMYAIYHCVLGDVGVLQHSAELEKQRMPLLSQLWIAPWKETS